MGINQIIFSEQNQDFGQIGGGAWLTDPALWPKDPKTDKLMLPVLMMTSSFLSIPFIPSGMALTVFISVEKESNIYKRSSIRQFTVHQQSEMDKISLGYSKVLLHTLAQTELIPSTLEDPITKTYIAQQPLTSEQMDEELNDPDSGIGISKVLVDLAGYRIRYMKAHAIILSPSYWTRISLRSALVMKDCSAEASAMFLQIIGLRK